MVLDLTSNANNDALLCCTHIALTHTHKMYSYLAYTHHNGRRAPSDDDEDEHICR